MRQRVGSAVGKAHAKTILLGEHAVVYGRPAIAFPIPVLSLQATASYHDGPLEMRTPLHDGIVPAETGQIEPLEKHLAEIALRNSLEYLHITNQHITVSVEGMIPPARGLGSSAAVAGAIADAVAGLHGRVLSSEDRFTIVQSVEKIAHGTPSGLDAYTTASRTPLWFEHGKATELSLSAAPVLLVADTGESGRTAAAVADVALRYRENTPAVEQQLDRLAALTVNARTDLQERRDEALGEKLVQAHEILRGLGVSSERLDALVRASLDHGALGAKLTGGGQGGCIIVLAPSLEASSRLTPALLGAGAVSVWPIHPFRGTEA